MNPFREEVLFALALKKPANKRAALLDAVCELAPRAWQASFKAARVGLRPACPDELPMIGRSGRLPGLVYATGHFRNGVLLAPLTAKLVADIIVSATDDPALTAIAPGRFGEY